MDVAEFGIRFPPLGVFVLDLDREDGASVFFHVTLAFLVQPGKVFPDQIHIDGVVASQSARDLVDPIRESPVSAFPVHPRAQAEGNQEVVVFRGLKEFPNVFVPGEVEFPLDFFMVNPKRIRGDRIDSQRLHLLHVLIPILFESSGVLEFPNDGEEGLAVLPKELIRDGDHSRVP